MDVQSSSLGVGVDVASIDDVAHSIQEFGDRYLSRVYTQGELQRATFGHSELSIRRLTECYAVKEAVVKALPTSTERAIDWRWIDVVIPESGHPLAHLRGAAYDWAELLGIKAIRVSVTCSGSTVTAVVVVVASGACRGH